MAHDINIPVLQVVGYQNSGKTTLVNHLLQHGHEKDLHIGVIKHHGHSDHLQVNDGIKDTGQYRKHGAAVTGITAGKELEIHINHEEGWRTKDLVNLYQKFPLDLIIIEGFKKATFPKILMVRSREDLQLLQSLNKVVAVITWMDLEQAKINVPVFLISEEKQYIPWIFSLLRKEMPEK